MLSSLLLLMLAADPLGPGDHTRTLEVDGRERTYLVHVPPRHDAGKPTPVVLVLHGAGMNGAMMSGYCGMNEKADEAGFLAVYPGGTGRFGLFLVWNSGGFRASREPPPDDVKFIAALLDDLATVARVDPKRVYATGLSNGGMMCYRLAAELSDRIAAVAPVAGTMGIKEPKPARPVPLVHFHGTEDRLVPYDGPRGNSEVVTFGAVEKSVATWAKLNGCAEQPEITELPDRADDGTTVVRKTYAKGCGGAEVVLYVIEGGGHNWPGQPARLGFLGRATEDISANDLIWEFFEQHPVK
jgi:polyhydroxybutyrate depolymerase